MTDAGTFNTNQVDKLKMRPIRKSEHLLFSFLGFHYFWNGADGNTIPLLYTAPAWFAPLIIVPYMLTSLVNIHNFGGVKYFITEEDEIVGTVILKNRQGMLCLYSLAVVPSKRKRGIGFSVLAQAEKVAEQFKLQGLEVEVLKSNVSAQRLYLKFGFKMVAEGQMTKVFRKQV